MTHSFTCRMTVQYSFYNFTLLCRAALPGFAGDVVIAITLAAFRAVLGSEPSVPHRPILSVPISTATLAERNTFVSTEDETRVTDASLHAGLVAGATVACRLLTAGLGAGWATWVVMTAWGTLQRTEGIVSPCDGDSCSSTHVSIALYGLAKSHSLTSSGTHVVNTVSEVWLGGHDRVAGLEDTFGISDHATASGLLGLLLYLFITVLLSSTIGAVRPWVRDLPAVSQFIGVSSWCIVWFQVVIFGISIEISTHATEQAIVGGWHSDISVVVTIETHPKAEGCLQNNKLATQVDLNSIDGCNRWDHHCPIDLDFAAFAEDDSHSVHIDHHSLDIGNLLITSSVFILGVHSEVWHAGGNVARLGQGVRAGSHIMVGVFVKGCVVGITTN